LASQLCELHRALTSMQRDAPTQAACDNALRLVEALQAGLTYDWVRNGWSSCGTDTFPQWINQAGVVTGWYSDASSVSHGFLRTPYSEFTNFDAPGAGTGAGQGTIPDSINNPGAIVGYYVDSNNVVHSFLFAPK
jgi:hypothetical protein